MKLGSSRIKVQEKFWVTPKEGGSHGSTWSNCPFSTQSVDRITEMPHIYIYIYIYIVINDYFCV